MYILQGLQIQASESLYDALVLTLSHAAYSDQTGVFTKALRHPVEGLCQVVCQALSVWLLPQSPLVLMTASLTGYHQVNTLLWQGRC